MNYKNKPRRKILSKKDCPFCKNKIEPDYKDVENLKRFVTERGKLDGSMYTGVCKKHQMRLTKSVKRARFLALLPFIVRPS